MGYRNTIVCLLSTALALGSAEVARADGAEAFVGGLLGSAIGTAITNGVQQRQQQRVIVERHYVQPKAVAPQVDSYQRAQNRQVQTALNYFGFPAGPSDGVMGANSRSAVAQYQATLGYPPSGVLMENERMFLISSYERAVVGGPQAAQVVAASGTRGLLLAYRQEQFGVPATPAAPPSAAPVVVPAAAPVAPQPAAMPVPVGVVPASAPAALPSFMPAEASRSMAGLCNKVTMDVGASGGPISTFDVALDDPDPMQVLNEQFCVARSHAIDQAKSLIAAVQGFTPEEMRSQCEAFAPTMARFTGNLAGRAPAEVGAEVRAFLDGTGAAPAQMSGTARICLGIGYSTDNAQLALASAVVLAGLGEPAYDELVGFQVVNGYGVPSDCSCGLNWTQAALEALGAGARPLVADPDGERAEVLTYAVDALREPASAPTPTAASAEIGEGGFALPKAQ